MSHVTPPQPLDQHGDSCVLICAHGQASVQVSEASGLEARDFQQKPSFPFLCSSMVLDLGQDSGLEVQWHNILKWQENAS